MCSQHIYFASKLEFQTAVSVCVMFFSFFAEISPWGICEDFNSQIENVSVLPPLSRLQVTVCRYVLAELALISGVCSATRR
jgi:hypothetical protein